MVAVDPLGFGGPPRMTDEQWASLPEDEEGELVDGMLVEEEVPDWVHEIAVGWLIETLRRWAVPRGGLVGGSELKYIVRPGRGRKPDVSMILPGQKRPSMRGALRAPADVVIEVVSPTPRDIRRDRIEKMADYSAFRVRYYWILDPAVRTFEIFELGQDGRYTRAVGAFEGKVDPVPGCEGLVLDLEALWSELNLPVDDDAEDMSDQG